MKNCSSLLIPFLLTILLFIPNPSVEAQVPNLPAEDDNVYHGTYWGAAGIAEGLLEIANNSILDEELNSEVEQLALDALDKVWDQRYVLENGDQIPSWTKYKDGDIYPGQKYGAAGISINYMNAYQFTGDEKYLDRAKLALEELLLQASYESEYPNWPYAYNDIRNPFGIPISDVSFGSLGILEALLSLYEITGESQYLDKSLDIYNWLELISVPFESKSFSTKLLPWYTLGEDKGPLYTSLLSGNGAAIELFIKLGNLAEREDISDWGVEIANAYVELQHPDGNWTIIFDEQGPNSFARTTLESGSAGILLALIGVSDTMNDSKYDNAIEKGIDYLESAINQTDNLFFVPISKGQSTGKYSLHNGLTGILKATRMSNMDQYDDILENGYSHLINRVLYEGKIEGTQVTGYYPSTYKEPYTDLSLSDGLMGVVLELLDLYNSDHNFLNSSEIKQILTSISNTYIIFSNADGLWPKQVTIKPLYTTDIDSDSVIPSNTKKSQSFLILDFVAFLIIISYRIVHRKR